jgi:type II secretory pathway pseudopilin PulG
VSSVSPAPGPEDGESGATLIELLVAIVIMGLAFVIIVGGIATAILGSETQKETTAADVALRTAAEKLAYTECPVEPPGTGADYAAQLPDVPDFVIAVTNVSYWNGADQYTTDAAFCDRGLHLVELRASPIHGKTKCTFVAVGAQAATCEPLQVVKRRP